MTQHVRNILKVYRMATPDDTLNGVEWYARANRAAHSIATATGIHERTVIGVMAALSPNNRWERNVIDAHNTCSAFAKGMAYDTFKVSTYNSMKKKAWSILKDGLTEHDEILDRLNGQKIRSFYSNIAGLDEVTIDGHAYNIAIYKRQRLTSDDTNIGVKLYRELQAAYVRAAKRVGVKPHVLQAVTWTVWRRIHNI